MPKATYNGILKEGGREERQRIAGEDQISKKQIEL
jgi:hypothetical protein